jgi:hypothetical protein
MEMYSLLALKRGVWAQRVMLHPHPERSPCVNVLRFLGDAYRKKYVRALKEQAALSS